MKNNLLKSLLVIGTVFVMSGCGGGSSSPVDDVASYLVDPIVEVAEEIVTSIAEITISDLPVEIQDAIDEPKSILTQDLKESIAHMYNEEGLAYDVYMNLYKYQVDNNLPTVNQFQQIASGEQDGAEVKHIEAVNQLAIKYDLNITDYPDLPAPYSVEGIGDGNYSVEAIQVLYDILYEKGKIDKQNALEVGCMVEMVDIIDLEAYIKLAKESNATDALEVFNFLINGSYKHYQQFDKGLQDMGVASGCCIVPAALGYDSFCNDDYLLK